MEDMEVLIWFHGIFFKCKTGGFSLAMLHADFCGVEAPDSICKMFNFRRKHPGISAEIDRNRLFFGTNHPNLRLEV